MSDPVTLDGFRGERFILVDGYEVFELRTEAEARRFLEELGEKAIESIDPRMLPPGLQSDFEASASREDRLTVLAQMLSAGRFRVVRLQRPSGKLDAPKSVPLSDLIEPKPHAPAVTVKETFAYEVRIVDELGEPVEGVPVSLSVSGSPRRLVTDGDGRVKVDDATTGASVVQLPDLVALQDALRPRWEQARGSPWLDESDDHTYVDCSAPLPSVQVRAGRLHTIVVQPRVICARVLDLLFDTNKCFLLPSALEHIREIRKLYDTRPRAKVLIVGHTDTTGEPEVNDPLSLNRAKAVKAYLRDDVDTWLDFYGDHMHPKARWGAHEDHLMLQAVLAESGEELTDTPVRHFQATRGLEPDNKLGDNTRRAIITEYMAVDGTTLPEGIDPIAHGCGENFPLEPTEDGEPDHARDRRVELFFFDADLGVLPPPSGDNSGLGSSEYPEWRRRSVETHAFVVPDALVWEVRFVDRAGKQMPRAPYLVHFGGGYVASGIADDDGVAFVHLPPWCPERVFIAWGPPTERLEFSGSPDRFVGARSTRMRA
jgi:outer membrane protein OmpA-like peptidoglycan-associated protein